LIDDPDRLLTNADFLGNPVYISFWATWCGPCLPKLRTLAELHERYEPEGFQLLTISNDFERQAAIDYRDAYQPMPWAQAFIGAGLDAQEGTMADLGVLGIPHGILVDAEGYVVAVDNGSGDLETVVAALMRRE
jgi:thiol-disulfide isomerase/thioredoxin